MSYQLKENTLEAVRSMAQTMSRDGFKPSAKIKDISTLTTIMAPGISVGSMSLDEENTTFDDLVRWLLLFSSTDCQTRVINAKKFYSVKI